MITVESWAIAGFVPRGLRGGVTVLVEVIPDPFYPIDIDEVLFYDCWVTSSPSVPLAVLCSDVSIERSTTS